MSIGICMRFSAVSPIPGSIVASITACHAVDPGLIPGRGDCCVIIPRVGTRGQEAGSFKEEGEEEERAGEGKTTP